MELFRRILAWWRWRKQAAELNEELETHRALAQEELERSGLASSDAEIESRRRMGNIALSREDARDVWVIRWIDRLRQHVRYGARGLLREPAFALTAIATLALGFAASTTVFSVVDAELWRPLPFSDPHQLMAVVSRSPKGPGNSETISLDELLAWRRAATAFSQLAALGPDGQGTAYLDHAESLDVQEVTTNFFTTLGRRPLLGRVFASDDADGSASVVLTSTGWNRVFGHDPSVVGRSFTLDDRRVVIVGVVAADETMGSDADVYAPIDEHTNTTDRQGAFYGMIGRLSPGSTPAIAAQQIQAEIDRRGLTDSARRGHRVFIEDLSAYHRRSDARPLYFFLGAALLVMALTIVNVAGLLVSRAIRRTPEFALRGALGGGTAALASQMIVEGALVVVPGCAIGLVVTRSTATAIGRFVPYDFLLRGSNIPVDLRAGAFVFGVALATAAALAVVPLGIVRRAGSRAALGSGTRTGGAPRSDRARQTLLIAQLGLTLVLLAGASVFVKSFLALKQVPLGFDPTNAWSVHTAPSGPSYSTPAALRAYADDTVSRLQAIPGVRFVSVATTSPLGSGWIAYTKPGTSAIDGDDGTRTLWRGIGPDYFRATGTRIVRGRGITSEDRADSLPVAVVNEGFARQAFAGVDPIGQAVSFLGVHNPLGRGTVTIVGVAENIKELFLNESVMPDIYMPFAQHPMSLVELLVRTDGPDPTMSATLRDTAATASVPVTLVSPLTRRVDRNLERDRFNVIVVGWFAATAVLMAMIGVYGAMAYVASARRREFAVRLALGATPRQVLSLGLWQAARFGVVGGLIGLGGALFLAMAIGDALYLVPGSHNGLLYDVKVTDPAALTCALVGVVALATIAGAVPARRSGQVDPSQALRGE
jgi:predicted permease